MLRQTLNRAVGGPGGVGGGGRALVINAGNMCRSQSTSADQERGSGSSQPWVDEADTVVIGGGAVGVSVAYHVAKGEQAMSKKPSVVLLEKSELTAGSTWHAAGLTTTYHPLVNLKRLHWYSLNFFKEVERESGQQIGLHQPGSLRLATTPERMDEFRYQISRQNWCDAPARLWDLDDIRRRIPIMDVDGGNILGGLFTAGDGHVDPYSLTQAIAAAARGRGARIYQRAEVTAVNQLPDGRWELETPAGSIKAGRVVNASGFWARELATKFGQTLPLVPNHHQYLVTKTVPEVKTLPAELPVLRHLEGSFYMRQERDGLLIGPYESPESMRQCEDWTRGIVPPDFGKELFEPDLDRLQPHLEVAMQFMPCFQNAEIQSVVNGPITYTPDVLPMLGPTLAAENLWMAVGFGYGIAHSGGAGKYLADWMLNGEPDKDLVECDPDRFMDWADLEFTLAKTRETYGMNNAMGWPHEDRTAGRPVARRVTPIHDLLVKDGAFMAFSNGWESPEWYSVDGAPAEYKPSFTRTNWHEASLREYFVLTKGVAVKDLSTFAKFVVKSGNKSSAREYLDHLVCGRVPAKPGRTTVAHAITEKEAKVYAELTLTAVTDEEFLVITGGSVEGHDLRHMRQVARSGDFDVSIENVTESLSALSAAGPKSGILVGALTGIPEDDWKFLDAKKCKIAGADVLAVRITYTGELGWEFYMDREDMRKVYLKIMEEGKDLGIGHFGTISLNILRLEKGFKMWGSEMNLDTDLVEAGLDMFVNWKKKCDYVGKLALLRKRDSSDLKNKLVMLSVDSNEADPEGNEAVYMEGSVVGNTTSGCFSPVLGKGLAFAYVPNIAANDVGCKLEVEILGEKVSAEVLQGPPALTYPVRLKAEAGKKKGAVNVGRAA